MPKPYPKEFREDVIRVARESGGPIKQVALDFGITESCLRNWLHQAAVEDGTGPGATGQESAELRELRRRNRLLEENEVLRRAAAYLSQAQLRSGGLAAGRARLAPLIPYGEPGGAGGCAMAMPRRR